MTTRTLLVLTSHSDLGGKGETGAWASEAAEPWVVFTDAGCEVTVATIAGGRPPFDALKPDDQTQQRFLEGVDLDALPAITELDPADFDIIFLVGGHGTMWDFPTPELGRLVGGVWDRGGVVSAVCHGPAGLLRARDASGALIIEGRSVTGFSNAEELLSGKRGAVPFLLADELEAAGAKYESGLPMIKKVVVDGRLVTGQNPTSAKAVAERALEVTGHEPAAG